ncbi:MAG: sugar transferase, partial [Clostridium saudiense]|nr:sugar transferase [Clostridium saudiense]
FNHYLNYILFEHSIRLQYIGVYSISNIFLKKSDFLRKTSLDELPQIINILKGDMSIIGPRPVVDDEIEKYGKDKAKFLAVKPGLTGYWAANGRSATTYEDRINMELYYVDHCSLLLDIQIFFKTILSVLKKEGAK